MHPERRPIEKIRTGIAGFDELAEGGVPRGRAVVVSGTAGSGKTVFGLEFLYRGAVEFGESGTFVTFEERREDLIKDVQGFGWDLPGLEKKGKLAFVDASSVAQHQVEVGEYDFGALIGRIKFAVAKVGAKRVVIDSVAALFLRYKDQAVVRRELFKLIDMLRRLDVTTVITAERVRDEDESSRFGVEDFVADSVIYLYNSSVGRERERQVEIVKLRGAGHQTGKHPFLIGGGGLTVFPNVQFAPPEGSGASRLSIGVKGIDDMTDGGLYRGSTTLLLGPSGTGRTVLGLHFLAEGAHKKERGILFSFEEGVSQLRADAKSLGWNFAGYERSKLLRLVAWQPEAMPIESYLKKIRRLVDDAAPKRVVIDSLTPLARAVDEQRFRRFVVALNSYLKSKGVTTIVNYTTDAALSASVASESDMAVVADNIIVMKLSESGRNIEREISIAKSRASAHVKTVRRYVISSEGMCVLDDRDQGCEEKPKRKRKAAPARGSAAGGKKKKR
ncbi:MAG TPA: circadian clock protein KaiC [Candidatus Binatia bacterium]|jgi:circadian clock protein KaiC|nr:circadian clock protein KaiC [Candidatus Binatia bacterium]